MKTTIEETKISSEEDLNAYAELLRKNGFTIIAPDEPSKWFHFMKDNKFGSVGISHWKWLVNFGAEHKPCREAGTSFSVLHEVDRDTNLTLENAIKTLKEPIWPGYVKHVKRYASIEDYLSVATNRILGNRIFKPL